MRRTTRDRVDLDALLAMMDSWAESWAYLPEDVTPGEDLVEVHKVLITDLHGRGLSQRTLRRHLDSAWAIGGEVVRGFSLEPERRSLDPVALIGDVSATSQTCLPHSWRK